jgi:hypothetical protein
MWRPGSLLDAMSLAGSCERRAQRTPPIDHQLAAPCYPSSTTFVTGDSSSSSKYTTLTPVAMANRHKQGLCYNCDERFMPGHHYKKLFVLEIDPGVDGMEDNH